MARVRERERDAELFSVHIHISSSLFEFHDKYVSNVLCHLKQCLPLLPPPSPSSLLTLFLSSTLGFFSFRSLAQVLFLVLCLSLPAFKQRKSRCFLVIRAMLYFENVHLNFDCENRSISRKCMTENHCECLLKNTRNTEMLPMIVTVV